MYANTTGGPPSPADCDGIHTPCTYSKIGEIDTNVADLLTKEDPTISLTSTPYAIHFDMAPAFYIKGQPDTGDPVLRKFEVATSKLTAVSPITGNTDVLTRYLADHVEMKLLHMITADSLRTPSFVMFGNPDYFFLITESFPFKCANPGIPACPDLVEEPGFAWNHGGVDPKINTTFLGLVGPGVRNKGIEENVWSDHTDIRPTMLELLGLRDSYDSDGCVLVEILQNEALPVSLGQPGDHDDTFLGLARVYKRINAPVGELGLTSLNVSTTALAGDDATYTRLEGRIADIPASVTTLPGGSCAFWWPRSLMARESIVTRQSNWWSRLSNCSTEFTIESPRG